MKLNQARCRHISDVALVGVKRARGARPVGLRRSRRASKSQILSLDPEILPRIMHLLPIWWASRLTSCCSPSPQNPSWQQTEHYNLPCSSSSSSSLKTLQSILNGLLDRPVTLCFKCAKCFAKIAPHLLLFALVSKSVRESLHNSNPLFGNFFGFGGGFRWNFLVHHVNHDLICVAFHSDGSVRWNILFNK